MSIQTLSHQPQLLVSNQVSLRNQQRIGRIQTGGRDILEVFDGLPYGSDFYYRFEGSFLRFGQHICRAVIVPGMVLDRQVMLRYCRTNPAFIPLFSGWRGIMHGQLNKLAEEVVAIDMWDFPEQEFNLLIAQLDNMEQHPTVHMTMAREHQFAQELAKASANMVPKTELQVAYDIENPENYEAPSLMEVAASTFLNGLTPEATRMALCAVGHDPTPIIDQKVAIVQQLAAEGGFNPELSVFQATSGSAGFDALVYNDGYLGYLSRVVGLERMAAEKNLTRNLRKFRPNFTAWATPGHMTHEHRMLRLIYFHAERLEGRIYYSLPSVCEITRNSPSALLDRMLFPLMMVVSSYSTDVVTYPVMNVFCLVAKEEKYMLTPMMPVPPVVHHMLNYAVDLTFVSRHRESFLCVDAMKKICSFLAPDDVFNLSLVSHDIRSQCSEYMFASTGDYYDIVSSSSIAAKYYREKNPVHRRALYHHECVLRLPSPVEFRIFHQNANPMFTPTMVPLGSYMQEPTRITGKRKRAVQRFRPTKRVRHLVDYNVYTRDVTISHVRTIPPWSTIPVNVFRITESNVERVGAGLGPFPIPPETLFSAVSDESESEEENYVGFQYLSSVSYHGQGHAICTVVSSTPTYLRDDHKYEIPKFCSLPTLDF